MKHRDHAQRGAALVLAIFTLMLISVVGTALILMAGTQAAVKANYKSAMHAFYDAKAGLEEARGRLYQDPAISTCVFPAPGAAMPLGRVCYIINPSAGEVVNPLDLSPDNPYADAEYQAEFQTPVTSANVQPFVNSNSAVGGLAGPLYKWVRITPTTESSSNIAVSGNSTKDNTTALFYIGSQNQEVVGPTAGAGQVLSVTALAFTPHGSRRIVQYTVAADSLASEIPNFPSALTLDGNDVSSQSKFPINGNDLNALNPVPGVPAIGYTNSSDSDDINAARGSVASPSGVPPVSQVLVPPAFQTPAGLDYLVQQITAGADKVVSGPVTQSDSNNVMPTGMVCAGNPASNPVTIVIQGDLTMNGWHGTGCGLLVVTGNFTYDPDGSWNGIILVIGKGSFYSHQNGTGQIRGAVLLANTRDQSGNLLADLGPVSFQQTSGGGGIRYSSNLINSAPGLFPYRVLSFREIQQQP